MSEPGKILEPGEINATLWQRFFRMLGSIFSGPQASSDSNLITHKDKTGIVDAMEWRKRKLVDRLPKEYWNIVSADINANIFTCVRAITDALSLLPINVVSVEESDGKVVYHDDNEHPANQLLNNPNPRYTFNDIKKFIVGSYLLDGNGFGVIEPLKSGKIELWPRNPRHVTALPGPNGHANQYEIANVHNKSDEKSFIYPASRVLHVMDLNYTNPYYGKSRIEAVRQEIAMDNYVNRFNAGFFVNGGALNLMFTPDHDLTQEQHEMLLDAIDSEVAGVDNAFTMFINRFGGKIEHPDQKHKDIAFLDLLKHNREKIFSQFGLPPFRGGVMEWANYANALQQDLDFWNNSIKPITIVIEDAMNKQIMEPYFGEGYLFKFSYEGIAALKGDPKERAEIDVMYVTAGIKTINEVRAELGKKPFSKKELEEIQKIKSGGDKPGNSSSGDDSDDDDVKKDESKKKLSRIIHKYLKSKEREITNLISSKTSNGQFMSALVNYDKMAKKSFNRLSEMDRLKNICKPELSQIFRYLIQGMENPYNKKGRVFDYTDKRCEQTINLSARYLEKLNEDLFNVLVANLKEADEYNIKLNDLLRRIRNSFNMELAEHYSNLIVEDLYKDAKEIVFHQDLGI